MNYNQWNNQPYRRITYRSNNRIIIDKFLDELHNIQLDFIDEALEKSDLKEANDVISYIKGKINNEPQV